MARTRTADDPVRVRVDGQLLSLSHLDRVLWPDEGLTKRDLLRYYQQVAPWILPHLRDRPLTREPPDHLTAPHEPSLADP